MVTHAVTSSQGSFNVTPLAPGHYTVAVQAPGFKSAVEAGVLVEITKVSSLSIVLSAGAQNETVTVRAESVVLDTSTPEVGTTIEPVLVRAAPIEISGLTRQIDSFIFFAPGVQGSNDSHTINGGVNYENEILFNGVPLAQALYQGNQTFINPPFEMVDEFHVSRATFSSQYGLGQGAVTYNMTSGTNKLHGDAFEILKNQLFDSKGFFPSRFDSNGKPLVPIDQQHDYGFTVGGTVWIPKLYNGHDRTFFLFSSDWFRQNSPVTSFGTVPTIAEKQGDFSNYVDANGNQIPIYDPQTGLPFSNNIIPQARFSPLSAGLLASIPDPDRGGPGALQSNKNPAVPSLPIRQHVWGYTLDHHITSSQSVHFTQWITHHSQSTFSQSPIVSPTNPLQSLVNNSNSGSGYLLNYVKTFSPSLVMTAGADRVGETDLVGDALTGVHFAGVAGSDTLPSIGFDGQYATTNFGAWGNYQGGLTRNNSRALGLVLVNNWLWVRGRHTLNLGGEFRRSWQNSLSCIQCGGSLFFSQKTTSTPDPSDPNFGSYGSSFASFLLGQVDSAFRISAQPIHLRNKDFSPYIQDDFKLNRKLTINAGLRWDIMVPFTENSNAVVYADPNVPDPGAGGLPGGATKFGNCTACAGLSRAAIHFKKFGPRFGFSYAVNPKTVLQAGFYLAFLDGGAYEYGTAQTSFYYSAPLYGQFNRNSTNTNVASYGSWDANPLPATSSQPFSASISNGNVIQAFDPKHDGISPYNETWTASLQRELPWDMLLNVAYVGNRTLHLPSTLQLPNQPNPAILSLGSLLGEQVNSPDAVAAGIKIPYPNFLKDFGGGATVEQALTPFPQYAGYFNNYELDGTSSYNALQLQAEKRYTKGFSFVYSLTLSRNTSNVSTGSSIFAANGLNRFDLRNEYTPSSLDQFYNTKGVFTYELPFGPGKRFLRSNGPLRLLTGGWQVSGILDYEGGTPFGPYNNLNPLITNGFDRPNEVPGKSIKSFGYKRSKDFFTGKTASQPFQFDPASFVTTGAFALGNAKRTYASLRNPAFAKEDFNAIKSFAVTERVKAILRLDYFNAFNRTLLYGPDTNSTDSTFGQITFQATQIPNRTGQATFRIEF